MAAAITRDELIERIAQVSHATWLVQGVNGGPISPERTGCSKQFSPARASKTSQRTRSTTH
jgi:hypothetical protein